jgi:hypothetical protein
MSRSGYSEDCDDQWALIRWRGAVKSAIRGKCGKSFLKEMLAALDAMPVKRLIANELAAPDRVSFAHWGLIEAESVCAIGAVGKARNIDMSGIDPHDPETVADTFEIADALAKEIVYENDEGAGYWSKETPEQRFVRMRAWVAGHIHE